MDKGWSWIKYEGNFVLFNFGIIDFCDLKVFWYGDIEKWVMIFVVGDYIKIYDFLNLIDWVY